MKSAERYQSRRRNTVIDSGPTGSRRPYCRPAASPRQSWRPTPREQRPPQDILDLLNRLWVSLDWRGAFQLTFIIVGIGMSAAIGLGCLILLARLVSSQASASVSAMVLAGSASALAARTHIRHREHPSQITARPVSHARRQAAAAGLACRPRPRQ